MDSLWWIIALGTCFIILIIWEKVEQHHYQNKPWPASVMEMHLHDKDTINSDCNSSDFQEKDWGLPDRIRDKVLSRDKYRCVKCGDRVELNVHHIIPVAAGGKDVMNNLITLCIDCHQKLHGYKFNFSRTTNKTKLNKKMEIIAHAMKVGGDVWIHYQDAKGNKTERIVTPQGFGCNDAYVRFNAFYGHCHLRNDERCFRISRIKKIKRI